MLHLNRRAFVTGAAAAAVVTVLPGTSRAQTDQSGPFKLPPLAYPNNALEPHIDARTMEKPRKFFGAARKVVGGGSLTVIGTALVDTGSRMDEVIFQEFKGTGNTEIVMDRGLFERRIFPAIDISKSGTRKEEKLFTPEELPRVTLLRRALASLKAAEAMQLLIDRLSRYPTNAEFLANLLS